MELILIAVLALVVLGSVDRRLHPQPGQGRPAATRRTPVRRKGSNAPALRRQAPSHRVAAGQVRPFLSLGPSVRR
jgi:hypothetical protein